MAERARVVPGLMIPVFVAIMGVIALLNSTTSPQWATYRTVDVVRLVGSGMCFGAALVMAILTLRGRLR